MILQTTWTLPRHPILRVAATLTLTARRLSLVVTYNDHGYHSWDIALFIELLEFLIDAIFVKIGIRLTNNA